MSSSAGELGLVDQMTRVINRDEGCVVMSTTFTSHLPLWATVFPMDNGGEKMVLRHCPFYFSALEGLWLSERKHNGREAVSFMDQTPLA